MLHFYIPRPPHHFLSARPPHSVQHSTHISKHLSHHSSFHTQINEGRSSQTHQSSPLALSRQTPLVAIRCGEHPRYTHHEQRAFRNVAHRRRASSLPGGRPAHGTSPADADHAYTVVLYSSNPLLELGLDLHRVSVSNIFLTTLHSA